MHHPRSTIYSLVAFSTLAVFVVTVAADDKSNVPLRDLIDQHIQAGFKKWNVTAAKPADAAEFVRRCYLDFTGNIPTAAAAREFISSKDPDKRAKLIDQLLASPEFANHFAVRFDIMLMERRPDKYVTLDEWRGYLADSFANNKPLDVLVREILGGDGTDPKLHAAAKFYLDRAVEKDTLVRDIGRLFLGVDLQCAQCHDHPSIDDYLHEHYYGLSAFIVGSKTFRQKDGKTVLQEMVTPEVTFASVFSPDKSRTTGPRLLNGPALKVSEVKQGEEYVEKPSRTVRAVLKFSLRKLLGDTLPRAETPAFTRNMTNRLWTMLMGRGIVHPLDMHRSGNPPSHPELLDLLATRFGEMKFDTKAFLRELALSQTYQRSSSVPDGLDPDKVPPESFTVANMKGLSPEQLFDSVLQATGSHAVLDGEIEEALKEDAEKYKELRADADKLKMARMAKRAERLKEFVNLFGALAGNPEGEFQASLPQALFLANSETIIGWIEPADGNLTEQLLKHDDAARIVDETYFNVLSRSPTDEEKEVFQEYIASRGDERRLAVIEFVWSLVASAEFRLNH